MPSEVVHSPPAASPASVKIRAGRAKPGHRSDVPADPVPEGRCPDSFKSLAIEISHGNHQRLTGVHLSLPVDKGQGIGRLAALGFNTREAESFGQDEIVDPDPVGPKHFGESLQPGKDFHGKFSGTGEGL